MRKDMFGDTSGILARCRRHSAWRKAVAALGCVVVFCTTYALILPAITLEKAPACGKEEHIHTESCYTQITSVEKSAPICTLEGLSIHQHTDACQDGSCGYADFSVHKHSSRCYGENGQLWCSLPEIEAHTHEEICYETPEAHVHGKGCYTRKKGELTCTESTEAAHTHTEGCYAPEKQLTCALTEGEGHAHGEGCYDENGAFTCTQEEAEGHTHNDACYESVLTCTESTEPAHVHTDECYTWNEVLTCTESTGPKAPVLACGKEEILLHEHTQEDCFETDEEGNTYLVCEKIQILEHVHTDACFETVKEAVDTESLTCGLEEGAGAHTHGEGCYDENKNLTCALEESEGHRHTPLCYGTWELTCGLEAHTHGQECMLSPELTGEEQAQVDEVIAQIDALPSQAEVEERLAALEQNGDQAGYDAYLTELRTQVTAALDAYAALTEAQQAQVTNVDRLTALEWLRSLTLEEPAAMTVVGGDGVSATVEEWAPGDLNVQSQLHSALVMEGQGYISQEIQYYQISGLTAATATVTYPNGSGLSAANGAQVFVYDLGADGTAAPENRAVQDPQKNADTYTSFTFTAAQEGADASRVYAFVSAKPVQLDNGIYLGTKVEDGHWIAMDGSDETTANVKIDIQLTGSSKALPNCRPFILKVNEGEDFYPKDDAVRRAVGEVNDVQCYKIHWVEIKEDGNCDFDTGMEVGNGKDAAIELTYLKTGAQLRGLKGGRKLRIFSSKSTDGTNLVEISNAVQNVQLMEENYAGFTFNVTEPCPYVFVSEKVEQGYIDALVIGSMLDGSDPLDSNDGPGYDSSKNNRIVRSYDTIQYNLDATFGARQEDVTASTVNMYFELTLRKSATAAKFDTSKMLWLGENYSVEYLNDAGSVIMVMAHNGKYYLPKTENGEVVRDDHGFAQADFTAPVSVNARVNGSTEGANSYKVASGGVAMQRLVGWTTLTAKEGESILSGTQSFPMAVQVRNADNGETFAPAFRMWLEGNEANYGPETSSPDGGLLPAQPDTDNAVDISDPENAHYRVTVSAGTNFNVQLKKNGDMSYKNWFDFSTGKAVEGDTRSELDRLANLAENHGKSDPAKFTEGGSPLTAEKQAEYANYRYGRITCYGITLQLYNHTDNDPDTNLEAKGFRGLSLPVGDITFDLNFSSEVISGATALPSDEYTAILWDYNENIPADKSYSHYYQDYDRAHDQPGNATFLYAMDPDHPEGYDTNHPGILEYMNSVREEDLRYSTAMPDSDGYITAGGMTGKCVGVLMELRDCDLLGGKYQYMRIPVKVNGDDPSLVSKTVATVNTFRVWSWDLGENMTWANGQWNGSKNELEGFPKPENISYDDKGYSGELANSKEKSPPYYVKTEYRDNLQVQGTHAGGTLSGNSLLILSYKAGINIGVDKEQPSTGSVSYNLGDGESVVDYRLKNIRTEISDPTGQTASPPTTLTIKTVLDEGYTGENQRISVSGGSYRIEGYVVDADGNASTEKTSIPIRTDPHNPTTLDFVDDKGVPHRIQVYAQLGANSQSVTFVIQDAPVGIELPDITFQANFAAVTALKNNDTLKASAYISGIGDNRAYAQARGNTDNVTVGVILRSSTNLTKAVEHRYIELNGVITYDVTYTNSGTDTIPKIYFYDLLPHKDDIRGSEFVGEVVLREFKVPSTGANATVYYSTMAYTLPDFLDNVQVTSILVDNDGDPSTVNDQTDVTAQFAGNKITIDWYDEATGTFLYDNGATVTMEYTAVVTGNADIDGQGNTNTVTVTWETTEGPGTGKLEDHETIYTFAIALKKVDEKGNALGGAVFKLPFYVHADPDASDGAYIYAGLTPGAGLTNQLTTPDTDGVIIIKGVADQEYTIEEVTAPVGYNKLLTPVTVKAVKTGQPTTHTVFYLDENGNVVNTQTQTTTEVVFETDKIAATAVLVVNKTGAELPSTGGMGTTIFYVVGSILLAGAAVLLITKKRMSADK